MLGGCQELQIMGEQEVVFEFAGGAGSDPAETREFCIAASAGSLG
jgi:hypothetical protein